MNIPEQFPRFVILTPVFNDWRCLETLLRHLDGDLRKHNATADILVVNDGSTEPTPGDLGQDKLTGINSIKILEMVCNLGHQRAIAVGLAYLADLPEDTTVVVMDSDGEDRPEDVLRLVRDLERQSSVDVVFAGRHRRSEAALFRFGYAAYRLLHRLLTGVGIRFGNFSAIRVGALRQLLYQSSFWNHYAAAVVRSRLVYGVLPTSRGNRYQGKNKLNFSQLMVHGFSALSVFSDIVSVRLLIFTLCLVIPGGIYTVLMYLAGRLAGPALLLIGLAAGVLVVSFILNVISLIAMRSAPSFIPARDTSEFIKSVNRLNPPPR